MATEDQYLIGGKEIRQNSAAQVKIALAHHCINHGIHNCLAVLQADGMSLASIWLMDVEKGGATTEETFEFYSEIADWLRQVADRIPTRKEDL